MDEASGIFVTSSVEFGQRGWVANCLVGWDLVRERMSDVDVFTGAGWRFNSARRAAESEAGEVTWQAQKLAQAGEEGASSSTSVSGLPTCSTNTDTNLAQPAKRLKFGAKDTEEREVQSSIATELEDNLSVHIKDEPIEEHDESLAALPSNVNWSTDHFMVSEDEIPTRPFRFPTPETRLCRLCSANEGVEYIFEQKEHYLASKIMAISSIKLWKGDGLSEFICADCDILLEKFYDFRIHCEATDVTLRAEFLQTQKNQAPLPAVTETKLSKLNKRLENALSTFYNVMDKILRENQTSKHPGQNSCRYWNPRTQKKRLRREVVRAGSPLDRSEESTSPRAERCSNSNTTNTETGISSDYVNNEFIGTFKSASEILIKSEILSSSHDEDSENMTNIVINNLPSDISSENTPGYSSLSENSMSVSIVKQEETLDYQPLESNQLDYSLQVKTEDQFDDEYCHDVEPKVDIHTLSPSEIDGSTTLVATESDIEITNKVEKL
uniref:ZAD domain-containing protein n=1 Tax=Timema genevievae TaxID=629358 RepID=A0A7R9PMA0_TIMGE|nr:unnamed protein product [Timema genevievae]